MPAFCFPLIRFSHFHRSRRSDSRKPSPAGPRGTTVVALHSPGPSLALSSHSPSTPGAPEQAVDSAIGTSSSPAPSNLTHPQNSPGRICADKAPSHSGGQPSQASRPVTPTNVGDASAQSLHPYRSLAQPSPQSLVSERQNLPSGKDLPLRQNQNRGMFYQAHNFSATGNFINENLVSVTNNFNASNHFMKKLLQQTIPGAAADSSARDPPPRCHPGTRLAILERCLHFIAHCSGIEKMRWIVGAAGVGKSAVMQSVVDSPELVVASNASVFFSINGRSDGTKAIMTLSYQFAAKSKLYRQVIEGQVANDPSLLQSSMPIQFEKFIVDPFIHNPNLNSTGRVLIIIDGLDECNNMRTQVELLRLISKFCISYPSSPIVWLIASRPEPHILSFFSRPEVIPAYQKEEIPVDSDEAGADVERFLHHELTKIGRASDFLSPQWPDEQDFWKLAEAAGGLFAYAHTAIRYIGDSNVGDPVSQLSDVLNVIDELSLSGMPREQHPMAQLDALYSRILFNVPPKIMISTRKLLLALASKWDWPLHSDSSSFILLCNWLGMTADEAYSAIRPLCSVFYVPMRDEAHRAELRPCHKSIIDYLYRSGFSSDIKHEAQISRVQCAFRILREASDVIDFGEVNYKFYYGNLARGSGASEKISLAWPADEVQDSDDNEMKLMIYKTAIGQVVSGIDHGEPAFENEFCIRLLVTRFQSYSNVFPYDRLRDLVFDVPRYHELMKHGILKQVPLKVINSSNDVYKVKFRFFCPAAAMVTNLPSSWNTSCDDTHEQEHEMEDGTAENWTTNLWRDCSFCLERLDKQKRALSPDYDARILFTSTGNCCVSIYFVDPEDQISEWTYWFWINLSLKQRRMYGSVI